MLTAVKLALRISTNAYDTEIQALIDAAYKDLGKTYVRMSFGSPSDYDRLKRSYDEQKAQMQTATGYGL